MVMVWTRGESVCEHRLCLLDVGCLHPCKLEKIISGKVSSQL